MGGSGFSWKGTSGETGLGKSRLTQFGLAGDRRGHFTSNLIRTKILVI